MNRLKKAWVWLCRFRNRKGYGVHSPSAFFFIRSVLNEKEAYYAYSELKKKRQTTLDCNLLPEKTDRLLLRLSNYLQPETMVQVGTEYPLSLEYLSRGCQKARCTLLPKEDPQGLDTALGGKPLHLFHLTAVENYQEWFEIALPYMAEHSIMILEGIRKNREKTAWWKTLREREDVGLTFDLYELGLVVFDPTKYKQHYQVNFI